MLPDAHFKHTVGPQPLNSTPTTAADWYPSSWPGMGSQRKALDCPPGAIHSAPSIRQRLCCLPAWATSLDAAGTAGGQAGPFQVWWGCDAKAPPKATHLWKGRADQHGRVWKPKGMKGHGEGGLMPLCSRKQWLGLWGKKKPSLSPTMLGNFQPVSNLSFMAKVLEQVVASPGTPGRMIFLTHFNLASAWGLEHRLFWTPWFMTTVKN